MGPWRISIHILRPAWWMLCARNHLSSVKSSQFYRFNPFIVIYYQVSTHSYLQAHLWTSFRLVDSIPQHSQLNSKFFNLTTMYMRPYLEVPKVVSDRKELTKMSIKISDLFCICRKYMCPLQVCKYTEGKVEIPLCLVFDSPDVGSKLSSESWERSCSLTMETDMESSGIFSECWARHYQTFEWHWLRQTIHRYFSSSPSSAQEGNPIATLGSKLSPFGWVRAW